MVESEFAAMSACIGASAAGARTYTATASQGLLYMAEALYNASGLGLPIVMTVANRAIGAPINIWNDHSDSMSQRDSGWIQLYAETNQEAADLHVQAFRLAEELSLPVMVCMDGFILTHAYEQVDLPDAGAGRRLPAAVRAAPGPRPRRPGDDRRDGRARGLHRGQVPDARQAAAGARRDPADRRRVRGGVRPRLRRARARLPDRGRRDDRRRARLGARDDRGRRRRAARGGREDRRRSRSSASGPCPLDEVREALAGRRSGSSCSRRRSRSAPAASSARTCGSRSPGCDVRRLRRRRRPRRPADHQATRCAALFDDVLDDRLEPGRLHFLDLNREVVERELERMRGGGRPGPHAENILRDLGIVAARPH